MVKASMSGVFHLRNVLSSSFTVSIKHENQNRGKESLSAQLLPLTL